MLKRLFDILISFLLLIILSPLLFLLAVFVKSTSKGPVLFKPIRVGRNGSPFKMLKFRTMAVGGEKDWREKLDPDQLEDFVFQSEDDPRITKLGRKLRKTSLDELPNLLNVFGGSMSLVGPRPEEPEIVAHYTPAMRRRLVVKPGITGLAQISGRGDLPLAKTIAYDLDYIEKQSFGYDLALLFKTPAAVFSRRGAL